MLPISLKGGVLMAKPSFITVVDDAAIYNRPESEFVFWRLISWI